MLDKKSRNILLLIGMAILVVIITEVVRPKPIDWRPGYTVSNKNPFGGYIFYEEAENFFKVPIEIVNEDPFEFLANNTLATNSAYFFVDDYVYLDQRQFELLMEYVEAGNTAFLSSTWFVDAVADSLQFNVQQSYDVLEDPARPVLFSESFKKDTLATFQRQYSKTYFSKIDTLNTYALGGFIDELDPLEDLNFIKIPFGKGTFYLHTLPEAFSNYYLLHGSQQYVNNVVSYIDADKIYFDNYIKSGRKVITTPLRFVLSEAPLKWSYYLLIGGLVVFIIFKAKREQRIIEVVKPLENTSIEFTKTVGDLYFQHKDFGNIIAKKITYFLEKVRSQYYLDTSTLDENFVERLSQKSGNELKKTQKLVNLIIVLKGKTVHTEADVIELNKQLEKFTL